MKTIPIISILIILSSWLLPGQHIVVEEGMFAYTNNISGKKSNDHLQASNHKYKVTKKVLDQLVMAKGDRRLPPPTLKMTSSEFYVAYCKPGDALIGLEEKAYDICTGFGKDSLNALAALLAHELTHYYEKHDWTKHFIEYFDEMPVSQKMEALDEKMKLEVQADYLGGFLAYTAGYHTLDMLPALLEAIYSTYNIPAELPGYPSLQERKEMAVRALEQLNNLIPVFEAASYLVALEDYEGAKAYYDYILLEGQFQSREIYNNLGVMTVLKAIGYFGEQELKYAYPLELDPVSRISRQQKNASATGEREKIRKTLLQNAVGYLETAMALDDQYPSTLLNLSCGYALLGAAFDAEYYANKAIQVSVAQNEGKTQADASILLGILAAQKGNHIEAGRHFDQAIALSSNLGQLNKDLMAGKTPTPPGTSNALVNSEMIGDVRLDRLVNQLYSGELPIDREFDINRDMILGMNDYEQSGLFLHFLPYEEQFVFLHFTKDYYQGTTAQGVGKGTDQAMLLRAYGVPDRSVELTTGRYLVYLSQQILFVLDEKERVERWCLFRMKRE